MSTAAWAVPVGVVLGGVAMWTVFGLATGRYGVENAAYTVIRRVRASSTGAAFEVRDCHAHIVAETRVSSGDMEAAGSLGFRSVARYIFGGNDNGTSIAMTSPVQLQPAAGQHVVSFVLPARSSLETLPRPSDPRVTLRAVPRSLWAVRALPMRGLFSRRLDSQRFAVAAAALQHDVAAAGLRAAQQDGAPLMRQLSYDPPWTPFFVARNEVALALVDDDASAGPAASAGGALLSRST